MGNFKILVESTTSSFKNKHVRQISQNLIIPDFQGDASLLNNTCAC